MDADVRQKPRVEWASKLSKDERRELVRSYAIDVLVALSMEERIEAAKQQGESERAAFVRLRQIREEGKREPTVDEIGSFDQGEWFALRARAREAARQRRRLLDQVGREHDTLSIAMRDLLVQPSAGELSGEPNLDAIASKWRARARQHVRTLLAADVLHDHHRERSAAKLEGEIRKLDGWVSTPLKKVREKVCVWDDEKKEWRDKVPAEWRDVVLPVQDPPDAERVPVLKTSEIPDLLKHQDAQDRRRNEQAAKALKSKIADLGVNRTTTTGKARKSARGAAQVAGKKRKLFLLELRGKSDTEPERPVTGQPRTFGSKSAIEKTVRVLRDKRMIRDGRKTRT